VPEKPSWKRTWPVVLSQWLLRITTRDDKTRGEAETEGEQGYEVEDTSATTTEVDEARAGGGGGGGKGGVGKRRRVKGRRVG
jgi:hypothetical protein